ncbi:MAG: hypothetical protein WDN00_05970 [Limisphaerales bacterium]
MAFKPPSAELRNRLPAEWKNEFDGGWLTLQLKNEEVITAAIEKQFAGFMATEKKDTDRVMEKARTFKTVVTVVGFAIGIICICYAVYPFHPPPAFFAITPGSVFFFHVTSIPAA